MAKYKEVWEAYDSPVVISYLDTEYLDGVRCLSADCQEVADWIDEGNTPDPAYTQAEIDALTADQTVHETEQAEAADEINLSVLAGKTYDQVDTYVENNVTDMASAKKVLKRLARIVLAIIKKLELEG